MQLFLSENIYKNLSPNGITVFCILRGLQAEREMLNENSICDDICVSAESLLYYLIEDVQPQRRFKEAIVAGLNEIIEAGHVKKKLEYRNTFVLDCKNLRVNTDNEFYTVISFDDVQAIFKIKSVNSFLILKYFIYLMGTINSSTVVFIDAMHSKARVVGNMTVDYISRLTGISVRSIIGYNKILEENKILHTYHQNDFVITNDGEIKQLPNVYGRYSDKLYVDTFAVNQQRFNGSYKYINKNVKNTNSKRRLSQMYNQLSIGEGKKYSKEEILEVYKYVLAENKKYENMYKKSRYDKDLEKIRDVSIFDKYDFIKNL